MATSDREIHVKLRDAGVSMSDLPSAVSAVTKLSEAAGLTKEYSVTIVTAALKAFSLKADQRRKIADILSSDEGKARND